MKFQQLFKMSVSSFDPKKLSKIGCSYATPDVQIWCILFTALYPTLIASDAGSTKWIPGWLLCPGAYPRIQFVLCLHIPGIKAQIISYKCKTSKFPINLKH